MASLGGISLRLGGLQVGWHSGLGWWHAEGFPGTRSLLFAWRGVIGDGWFGTSVR